MRRLGMGLLGALVGVACFEKEDAGGETTTESDTDTDTDTDTDADSDAALGLMPACRQYIDAVVACVSELYADDPATRDSAVASFEGVCQQYEGVTGPEAAAAAELLLCYTDLIAAGDCSSPEAYEETFSRLTECGSGSGPDDTGGGYYTD